MAVAVRKKYLAANPALDAKPILKDMVPAREKRLPWNPDQITGFFQGKFYHSCAPATATSYVTPDRAWRFWLPLIMLFPGARPNEICQLTAAHLKTTDAGTLYLDMLDMP